MGCFSGVNNANCQMDRLSQRLGRLVLLNGNQVRARFVPGAFEQDVNTAIDRGIAYLANAGAFNNPSSCGHAAGLCALALLEKRQSSDINDDPQGYENASAVDKARLDNIIAFIITDHGAQSFYSYRDGMDLMALALYLRTGGPNQVGATGAVNAIFDRIALNQTTAATTGRAGYWCYSNGFCNDSSTTHKSWLEPRVCPRAVQQCGTCGSRPARDTEPAHNEIEEHLRDVCNSRRLRCHDTGIWPCVPFR